MEKWVRICFAIVFLFGCMAWPFDVRTEEASPGQKAARKDIEKNLEATMGMPVLKGGLWQQMTPDSKVAFIWGFGHVIAIEQHLAEKYPELKRDGFEAKVLEGMAGTPMNDVIARIDKFYATNPDQIEMPVMSVLWATSIKPYIKTGIAGRPLN
ncbi:MAG TPA: hypothetical protein VEI96_04555 [Thermodesulfovibrionales bacterium]|nr:hypothetical protein [Thermodesulfovibrionales bacterium]